MSGEACVVGSASLPQASLLPFTAASFATIRRLG
jgi:hypothetical protein